MDSRDQRRISGGRGWVESAAGITYVAYRSIRISRPANEPGLLCNRAGNAVGPLWSLHGAEFRSLVLVLRNEPDPGVSADQNLGRRKSGPRCDQVFPIHVPRQRGDVAIV